MLLKQLNQVFKHSLAIGILLLSSTLLNYANGDNVVSTSTSAAATTSPNTGDNQSLSLVQSTVAPTAASATPASNTAGINSASVAATANIANTSSSPIGSVPSPSAQAPGNVSLPANNSNQEVMSEGEADNLSDNTDVQHNSATGLDPTQLFPAPNDTEKQAFNAVTQQMMPMTPEQIKRLRDMLDITQRAEAALPGIPPRSVIRTINVSLAPGSLPPPINLSQGFVTSLVFTDSTGANWPIVSFDLGNPKEFNVQWQKGSNILMVQATGYQPTNLAVTLQGLSTPVILTLTPGQQVVDYRDDLQIPGNGPNAAPVIQTGLPAPASNVLLGVLDGVAPDGAKVLQVPGNEAQAWLVGQTLYVRTTLTILSPSWISMMTSSDGTKAYEMPQTPSILVSEYGHPVELQIEGF